MIESSSTVPFTQAILTANFKRRWVTCAGREMGNERRYRLNAAVEGGGVDSLDGWRKGA